MEQYDLFISYRRKDIEHVGPMVDAFKSRGISVWFDVIDINEFDPITDRIRTGLANSKALLAWYSIDYPKSRACQMELTAAFIAAQHEGDVRRRVWITNPEPTGDHIEPIELRDEQYAKPAKSSAEYASLVENVLKRLKDIQTPLGAIIPLQMPQQFGRILVPSRDFVGRLSDLWKLHSALHGAASAIITGESPTGLAQVSGMGGVGKSLLAEEYALRFSAAYPAGIFWLHALGNDATRAAPTVDQQEAVRSDEFRNVAIRLGIDIQDLGTIQIEAAIAHKLSTSHPNSFLWVVDDLASGLSSDAMRAWLAPNTSGKTLITTRSREYDEIGNSIRLDVLEPIAAYELLCRYRKPIGHEEETAARGIAADLGHHPLALAVCSRALHAKVSLQSLSEFRTALGNQDRDELELAAKFASLLPSGHEPSVTATLSRSIRSLGEEGLDFLRMASSLTAAAIPPSLVASVFSIVDGLDDPDANDRAALAFSQAEKACLSERFDQQLWIVHALVSRAIRFTERDAERMDDLTASIISALVRIVANATDLSVQKPVSLELLHARELCKEKIDNVDLALLMNIVGCYDFLRGAYGSARELHEKGLDITTRVLGPEDRKTITCMSNLAEIIREQGDSVGARALDEKALEVSRRVLGEDDLDTWKCMNNLAETLRMQGDLPGARALQERVVDIMGRVLGEDSADTLTAMNNLADTLRAQGDLSGARALHENVLERRRRILGDNNLDTILSMSNLAGTLRELGRLNKDRKLLSTAREFHEKVLEVRRQVLGEEHPLTLTSKGNLAETLRTQASVNYDRELLNAARELHESVLESSSRIYGARHPNTSTGECNLLMVLIALGDLSAAAQIFQRLFWLLESAPESLSDTLHRQIRATIEPLRRFFGH